MLNEYTVRELTRWQMVENFSLFEASLLWCDVLPHASEDNFEDEKGLVPVQRAFIEAIDSCALIANVVRLPDGALDWGKSKVTKTNLVSWARTIGKAPLFLAEEIQRIESQEAAPESRTGYRTMLLELQEKAIQRFWLNYDIESPPTKREVVEWLCSKGCTTQAATAIDMIIRPDSLRRGGRPKRK